MEEKHIIITGGYSGIGLELTKMMVNDNCRVGLIVRDIATLQPAKEKLKQYNNNIDFFIADLSSQKNILSVAESINSKWNKIDVLFNNAGVMLGEMKFSAQQNEMHYEVNTLAPYLLTQSLYQSLKNAGEAMVVNTVTDGLNMVRKLQTAALTQPVKFQKLIGAYLQSKLALTLLMNNMAIEWKSRNIRIFSVSPGGNKTKLSQGSGMPFLLKPIVKIFYKNPSVGAGLLYKAVFEDKFKQNTGIYIQKNKAERLKAVLSNEQKTELLKGIKPN